MKKELLPELNVQTSRDDIRKAKNQMELNLAKDLKDNKKGFCKYVSNIPRTRKNVDSLLNEMGDLVTKEVEKVELLNTTFASVLASKLGLQESQVTETREKAGARKVYPW